MTDTLYKNVEELVNEYNSKLVEYGIKITLHRRSFKEDVEAYNYQSQHSFLNMLEYIFINKKIEEEKYHHIPNHYKLLVLQIHPLSKTTTNKNDCKKYAFLVYQLSRAHQGDKPIEWQHKEQSIIAKVEKRLKKLLKRAEKSTSPDWCGDTLRDALRYSLSIKYGYLENYCGKSRYFWETLWICVIALPVLLFAIIGLITSF